MCGQLPQRRGNPHHRSTERRESQNKVPAVAQNASIVYDKRIGQLRRFSKLLTVVNEVPSYTSIQNKLAEYDT